MILSVKALRAAMECVAKARSHYSLNGIAVYQDGRVIATDRCVLVEFPGLKEEDQDRIRELLPHDGGPGLAGATMPVVLELNTLKTALKIIARPRGVPHHLREAIEYIRLVGVGKASAAVIVLSVEGLLRVPVTTLDGGYPDIEAAFSIQRPGTSMHFDATRLRKILNAAGEGTMITWQMADPYTPAGVTWAWGNDQEVRGVIMPMCESRSKMSPEERLSRADKILAGVVTSIDVAVEDLEDVPRIQQRHIARIQAIQAKILDLQSRLSAW